MSADDGPTEAAPPDTGLDRATFLNDLATTLAGELEEVIGLVDASSFIGQVGEQLGGAIGQRYADDRDHLPDDPSRLAEILVDLKERIGGAFRIESVDRDEIVLVNTACPFGAQVLGRPSLCMMTTSVFGRIVADAHGYARVKVEEAIATGHAGCRVRISLRDGTTDDGYEFFG